MPALISERELSFLLYELLDTEALLRRPRYAEHSREVFDATLGVARRLAEDHFAPHYALGDREEPRFVDGTVKVLSETHRAWRAFAEGGFLNAHWDVEEGGLQLPETVLRSAMALFYCANVASAAYPLLTIGAANLLRAFGSDELKQRYLPGLGSGAFAGTMALTEPDQGSALGDIRTRAVPAPDGTYRIYGQKMFISGGDQDLTDNIIHMVLARIQGAPSGPKGLSLFLVPKRLLDSNGAPGQPNDVATAGLLHKMGWRNTTSTILSFGEREGAVGYLVGEPHRGLLQMFQMMNEARIGVGLIGGCLAYSGFAESLAYARERRQGRFPSVKDANSPQVKLVEHADVRRLLLTQKAYAEGSVALCLLASSLFEDQHTHPEPDQRDAAGRLLDILTPVVKSWPAKYGCVANDMAIQVLGGSGYTREYVLEQLYRDQRLNAIHEGVEAIHGLDLLGRKAVMDDGSAYAAFGQRLRTDINSALFHDTLRPFASALEAALGRLDEVTAVLSGCLREDPDVATANATLYLDVFGRTTLAWIWLKLTSVATSALANNPDAANADYYRGKMQTAHHFFESELPQATLQFDRLMAFERVTLSMRDAWFDFKV